MAARSPTAVPTARGSSSVTGCRWACGGSPSSTCPAAISRSRARTAACSPSSTARSTTIASSARCWRSAVTASARPATPRPSCTCTRSTATPACTCCAGCSPTRSGTGAGGGCCSCATASASSRSTTREVGRRWPSPRSWRRSWPSPASTATLDPDALAQYLTLQYVPGPATLVRAAQQAAARPLPGMGGRPGRGPPLLGPRPRRRRATTRRRGDRRRAARAARGVGRAAPDQRRAAGRLALGRARFGRGHRAAGAGGGRVKTFTVGFAGDEAAGELPRRGRWRATSGPSTTRS